MSWEINKKPMEADSVDNIHWQSISYPGWHEFAFVCVKMEGASEFDAEGLENVKIIRAAKENWDRVQSLEQKIESYREAWLDTGELFPDDDEWAAAVEERRKALFDEVEE